MAIYCGKGETKIKLNRMTAQNFRKTKISEFDFEKFGLVEVCDVCGKPLLKGQKFGRRKSNDALCHEDCLYYTTDKRITTK
ncbi:MAG: hypothetical protein CVT88_10395 [Candidatus Altiarchaeales archaeon HGW-Altiarchaeales-1]|nr:MAG: hypothetical protein CVT88_10395 [Candidatus Altiarchaeales archaeon HGW-Altiarchaeales-1]